MKKIIILIVLCLGLTGCGLTDLNSTKPIEPVVETENGNALLPIADADTCKVSEECTLTQAQAFEIALNSTCVEEGKIKDSCTCNENSHTYWFEMEVEGHEGCAPACVVSSATGQAEINWRCTGLIEEK